MPHRPLALALSLTALLAACDDSPTDTGRTGLDARYALVTAGTQQVPLVFTYHADVSRTVACVDTVFEQTIRLVPAGDVTWSTRSSTHCDDERAPVQGTQELEGRYGLFGETSLQLTLQDPNAPGSRWTVTGQLAGSELRLPVTVYTEENPLGAEWIWVYQRQD